MGLQKDVSKLTSVDESGNKIKIIPAEVKGYFHKYRARLHLVLLAVFLIIPWVHIGGQQIILLNIPNREFNFFGMFFRSHDAPLIFLLLAIAVLGLALVTAIWGRIWCGWACPQTVFIESVFRRIEIWTEGNYIERRRLQIADFSWQKLRKRTFKWVLFILVSLLIAHSFIAYFTGSRELLSMMSGSPTDNWTYFLLVMGFTALVLFDFVWFREQFCVIMCPYGRIQSVLMEPSSLAVVYDVDRGEPRKNSVPKDKKQGDCVSCNRCVEVCPTGIDIRNGLQMECIACTACIDACDDIMTKVKKSTGLIAYKTLNNKPIKLLKWKTIFYTLAILIAVIVLIFNLGARAPLDIALLRAIEAPYTVVQGENMESAILNHYRLHLTNQTRKDSQYTVQLSDDNLNSGFKLTQARGVVLLKAESSETVHLFIQLPQTKLNASGKMPLKLIIKNASSDVFERDLTFIGPSK